MPADAGTRPSCLALPRDRTRSSRPSSCSARPSVGAADPSRPGRRAPEASCVARHSGAGAMQLHILKSLAFRRPRTPRYCPASPCSPRPDDDSRPALVRPPDQAAGDPHRQPGPVPRPEHPAFHRAQSDPAGHEQRCGFRRGHPGRGRSPDSGQRARTSRLHAHRCPPARARHRSGLRVQARARAAARRAEQAHDHQRGRACPQGDAAVFRSAGPPALLGSVPCLEAGQRSLSKPDRSSGCSRRST
jgi:hypothetical protein